MAMNFDRHVTAHLEMFQHLVTGDDDPAEKHREFYDEYLAVMDLAAEYYMQTIETVFVRHALPKGEMTHRGRLVDLKAIRKGGLLSVEGEKDDISGVGQTCAANDLCVNIPEAKKAISSGEGRRPLRRLQWLAFPQRNRPAHPRVHRRDRRRRPTAKPPKLNGRALQERLKPPRRARRAKSEISFRALLSFSPQISPLVGQDGRRSKMWTRSTIDPSG